MPRRGAALVLSPEARRVWESSGSKFSHGTNGRVRTVSIPLTGQRIRAVGGRHAPGSGAPSDEGWALFEDLAVRTGSAAPCSIASLFVDAYVSAGVGVRGTVPLSLAAL